MTNEERLRQALELLRAARNNMSRVEFHLAIEGVCADDGNLRYPLMDAYAAALKTHRAALANASIERNT